MSSLVHFSPEKKLSGDRKQKNIERLMEEFYKIKGYIPDDKGMIEAILDYEDEEQEQEILTAFYFYKQKLTIQKYLEAMLLRVSLRSVHNITQFTQLIPNIGKFTQFAKFGSCWWSTYSGWIQFFEVAVEMPLGFETNRFAVLTSEMCLWLVRGLTEECEKWFRDKTFRKTVLCKYLWCNFALYVMTMFFSHFRHVQRVNKILEADANATQQKIYKMKSDSTTYFLNNFPNLIKKNFFKLGAYHKIQTGFKEYVTWKQQKKISKLYIDFGIDKDLNDLEQELDGLSENQKTVNRFLFLLEQNYIHDAEKYDKIFETLNQAVNFYNAETTSLVSKLIDKTFSACDVASQLVTNPKKTIASFFSETPEDKKETKKTKQLQSIHKLIENTIDDQVLTDEAYLGYLGSDVKSVEDFTVRDLEKIQKFYETLHVDLLNEENPNRDVLEENNQIRLKTYNLLRKKNDRNFENQNIAGLSFVDGIKLIGDLTIMSQSVGGIRNDVKKMMEFLDDHHAEQFLNALIEFIMFQRDVNGIQTETLLSDVSNLKETVQGLNERLQFLQHNRKLKRFDLNQWLGIPLEEQSTLLEESNVFTQYGMTPFTKSVELCQEYRELGGYLKEPCEFAHAFGDGDQLQTSADLTAFAFIPVFFVLYFVIKIFTSLNSLNRRKKRFDDLDHETQERLLVEALE